MGSMQGRSAPEAAPPVIPRTRSLSRQSSLGVGQNKPPSVTVEFNRAESAGAAERAGERSRRRSRSFVAAPESRSEGSLEPADLHVALTQHELSMLFVPTQWRWVERVGEGSFGAVQLGTYKLNGRDYAVKKIKNRDGALNEEVQREVIVMSALCHTNVVKYYGAAPVGAQFWIVME